MIEEILNWKYKNKKITLPILLPQFNTYLGNETLKSATF